VYEDVTDAVHQRLEVSELRKTGDTFTLFQRFPPSGETGKHGCPRFARREALTVMATCFFLPLVFPKRLSHLYDDELSGRGARGF